MRKILFIILMSMSVSAIAETSYCVDAETNGQILKVTIDWVTKEININNRKLKLEGENQDGSGITTNIFLNKNGEFNKYAIFQEESQARTSETWLVKVGFNEKDEIAPPANSTYKRLLCSKSFIIPFLKHKYS